MTKDEALKLALAALENMRLVELTIEDLQSWNKAAEFLHQALAQPDHIVDANKMAQPAQVPVDDVRGFLAARLTCWHRLTQKESNELVALFEVKPPQRPWVGLTDEEINKSYEEAYKVAQGRRLEVAFARVIEAKLKEKNT